MSRTVVQIPVTTDLRDRAYQMAISQGFSSLQEAMRLVMHQIALGNLKLKMHFEPTSLRLSEKAVRRYEEMDQDLSSDKNFKSAENINDLLGKLGYEED
jgi:antitoxin component of RelBE/YafQ-DinJ toxin-antitoxin module